MTPSPTYRVVDEFLSRPRFETLARTWPAILGPSVRSHADLYSSDPEFRHLSLEWMTFYRYLHSEEFWAPYMQDWNRDDIMDYPFDPDFREPRNGKLPADLPRFLYARADIGLGLPGYGEVNGGKGLHRDKPQRIISGLLYFTDQSELDGGEFEMCREDGSIIERVPLRKNRAVLSLQDEHGWHRVNPLNLGRRRAVYFALSCSQPVWNR